MMSKITILGAFALAAAGATPVLAQMSGGMSQSGNAMSSNSMSDGSMANSGSSQMTAAQMRSMKKCQAMSSAMAAKNKTCASMMKMHPEMMNSTGN